MTIIPNDGEKMARDARRTGTVEVLRSADALMQSAADEFVRLGAAAIRASGRFMVALSGGSTPAALYARLAKGVYARRVDWSRVHVFWGDERCVPPDDPASNYRMGRRSLLDHVPVPEANVHRMRGEDDPLQAAAAYERELRAAFATSDGPPRPTPGSRFDLVLLGLGGDGHTASLFPGTAAAAETRRWVVAQHVTAVAAWRITITPPLINAAAAVLFLVTGAEKAATLRRVLEEPYQPAALPAQAIAPHHGRLCWLVDAAAAAELRRK